MRRFYLLFYAIYPLALSNLLMAQYTTGYGLFNVLSFIPRSVRYIEAPIIILGYIWSRHARKEGDPNSPPVGLVPLAVLWIVGCLGFLASSATITDTLASLYTFSMPLLAFGTFWNMRLTNREVSLWRGFMYAVVAVNIVL